VAGTFPSSAGDLAFAGIADISFLLRRKKISVVELVEEQLARIARLNPSLRAFITLLERRALAQARRAQCEFGSRSRERPRPLAGIPITIKDNFWCRGISTTAGSLILRDFIPTRDATVLRRLLEAGAILLGKTNMHEFAYGITSANPYYGDVHNPWDISRISGGSSGGSAAALAAGIGYASAGSDTGGSIRVPSAFCGVVGLKPTWGRISCFGVVPLARSLDHTGPMARRVADVALLYHIIAGRDPLDPATLSQPAPRTAARFARRLRGITIGWPGDYFFDFVDSEVLASIESAARLFEKLGARIRKVSLPNLEPALLAANQLATAEATYFHTTSGFFPARANEYDPDVRALLARGLETRAVDLLAAYDTRRQAQATFARAFEHVYALLTPTIPCAAPPIGAETIRIGGREESVRAALLRPTRPFNFTGLPAMSLPCGFSRSGLPIGLQLIAPLWHEHRLFEIAHPFELAAECFPRHPPCV
jgi:aspartyl-tRNA(Asn)/glutamyl-tRNA(Gln) amidotransferase subunit A